MSYGKLYFNPTHLALLPKPKAPTEVLIHWLKTREYAQKSVNNFLYWYPTNGSMRMEVKNNCGGQHVVISELRGDRTLRHINF